MTQAAPRPSSAQFTLLLWLFLLVNTLVMIGLLAALSPGGYKDTVLAQTGDVLRGQGGDDSWGPMAAALDYARAQGPQSKPLYSEIFFERGIKFQYPPPALFALEGMRLSGADRVRISDEQVFTNGPPVNDIIGWLLIAAMAVVVAALVEIGLSRDDPAYAFDRLAALRVVAVAALTLTFYPVVKAFSLGQVQVWLNSFFALALLAWVLGRKAGAGAFIGLICLVKPHFGLFLVWAAVNREWRFFGASAVVIGVGLAFSLAAYGWANHIDYLRVLSFMSERGESYYPNQSINGLLNRLMSLTAPDLYNNATFDADRFPPYTPWVYWGTLASSAAILGVAILRRSAAENRDLAFAIVAVSLTVASPIAWEHHFGVLLPVFALVAASLRLSGAHLAWLALSYVLVSQFIPAANLLALTPFNMLQSYVLAGALILLVLMYAHIQDFRVSVPRRAVHCQP